MSSTVVQCILYLTVLVLLAIPLGAYIGKIMNAVGHAGRNRLCGRKIQFK